MATVTTVNHQIISPDDFCQDGGPNRVSLGGLFVHLLRDHFSEPDRLLYRRALGERIWRPTVEQTGIRIETSGRYTYASTDAKPAIIASRMAMRRMGRGIGDRIGTDLETGHESFLTFWEGGVKLLCTAKAEGEADLVAAEAFRYLTHFESVIRREVGLQRFYVTEITEPVKLKRYTDRWGVRISIRMAWDDAWTIGPENLDPFESVEINIDPEAYCQQQHG